MSIILNTTIGDEKIPALKNIIGKIGYTKREQRANAILRNKIHDRKCIVPNFQTKNFEQQLQRMKKLYIYMERFKYK